MIISVCIGSSCHLKGSFSIITILKNLIDKNNLNHKVEMRASFCLGQCTNGVTIKIDDQLIIGTTKENITDIFNKYVMNEILV